MIKTTQYIVVVLLMLVFGNSRSFAQYNGGNADGTHTDILTLTSCANPPQFYAYFGGIADGAHTDFLNNTSCASPPHFFAYMGGTGDGAHTDVLNNTSCANPPHFYAYFGGVEDGFASSGKVINCTTLTPVANFSVSTSTICAGQTVSYTDLSLNGASGWSWVFASGTPSLSSAQNPTVTYNTPGTYATTLTATNFNGSNTVVKINYIVVNALPTLSVNSGSICSGQSFTIVPGGANTYTYSGGSAVVSPTATTNYSVTGTNLAGCTNTTPVISTVTVNALPIITVNSGSICSGNSFTMNPAGASTYTYSSGSAIVSPTSTTAYTVTGTSSVGCLSSVGAVSTITVNTTPTITVNSGTICSGDSFTMSPNGASTYTYSSGAAIVSPIVTNNYTVTGSSLAGCVSAAVINTVIVNITPTVVVNSGSMCAGQSFTMNASGATSYTYSSGGSIVTPTSNTTYTVTGSNATGCVSSPVTSNVVVNSVPSLTASTSSTLICSGETATLTVMGIDTYSWSTGSTSTVVAVSPTITTNYTVTATNGFGCQSTAVITESVSPCIGINEQETSLANSKVFPNPNSGILNIVLGNFTEGSGVTISNALGQEVLVQQLNSEMSVLNINELSNGMYFVTITNSSGAKGTFKIVKQ